MVKTGQAWSGTIVTLDATGALAAATVGPAGVLYVDGTANGASVTVTGSNPYKWAVTLPTLTAGQSVSMYITATVGGIATGGIVAEDIADTKRVSDLNDAAAGLDAAGVRTAVGLATANLDTQLAGIQADTNDIQDRLPGQLQAGLMPSYIEDIANNVITAAKLAADVGTEIADAVRTELATELARIDAATSTRLATAGYTAPPSAATVASQVDVTLSAAHGSGLWGGSGAGTGTYSDTVTNGVDPLDNVLVQLSTDAAGTNMAYRTYSAADGTFTLRPDPGTYYVWLELAGYSFTQGAQVVVT